ncbi:hypothetical protein HL42_3416 [Trichophyton rubrum]|nr:hypothetical protein HL42_3416 [Trichophyton rubrum]
MTGGREGFVTKPSREPASPKRGFNRLALADQPASPAAGQGKGKAASSAGETPTDRPRSARTGQGRHGQDRRRRRDMDGGDAGDRWLETRSSGGSSCRPDLPVCPAGLFSSATAIRGDGAGFFLALAG